MGLISLYFRPTFKVLFSVFPLFANIIDDPGSKRLHNFIHIADLKQIKWYKTCIIWLIRHKAFKNKAHTNH